MCPPNQSPHSLNEEDNELFNLDFASLCEPNYFEIMSQNIPVCGIPNNLNEAVLPPIESDKKCGIMGQELSFKQSEGSHDELSADADEISETAESLTSSNDFGCKDVEDEYCRKQRECTKNFVLNQRSIFKDLMSQKSGKMNKPSSERNQCVIRVDNNENECTKEAFMKPKSELDKEMIQNCMNAQCTIAPTIVIQDSGGSKKIKSHEIDDEEEYEELDFKRRKLACKVCGDTASGFHYRVASCEACKAFFKRTVQGNIDYACPASGNCKINARGRKACQACRFASCMKAGMLKEGVRMDRKRGGRQKYFRRAVNDQTSMLSIVANDMTQEDNALMLSLKNCSLSTTRLAMSLLKVESMTPPQIWTVLAELFNRSIQDVIGGLNEIIGFSEFALEEKIAILKSSWSEVLTLKFICTYNKGERGVLKFAPNFPLSKAKAIECGMEDYFSLCEKVTNRISGFGGIHSEELLILQGIILVNAADDIWKKKEQNALKDKLLALLNKRALNSSSPSSPPLSAVLHVQNCLLILPSIKEAVMVMNGMWDELKGQIDPSNKLLIEMINR